MRMFIRKRKLRIFTKLSRNIMQWMFKNYTTLTWFRVHTHFYVRISWLHVTTKTLLIFYLKSLVTIRHLFNLFVNKRIFQKVLRFYEQDCCQRKIIHKNIYTRFTIKDIERRFHKNMRKFRLCFFLIKKSMLSIVLLIAILLISHLNFF